MEKTDQPELLDLEQQRRIAALKAARNILTASTIFGSGSVDDLDTLLDTARWILEGDPELLDEYRLASDLGHPVPNYLAAELQTILTTLDTSDDAAAQRVVARHQLAELIARVEAIGGPATPTPENNPTVDTPDSEEDQ